MFMPTEPMVMPMHPSTVHSMQPAVPSEQARANAESIPKAATIRGKSSLRANIVQIASCLDVQQEKELDVSGLGKLPPLPYHPILVVMFPSEILDSFCLSDVPAAVAKGAAKNGGACARALQVAMNGKSGAVTVSLDPVSTLVCAPRSRIAPSTPGVLVRLPLWCVLRAILNAMCPSWRNRSRCQLQPLPSSNHDHDAPPQWRNLLSEMSRTLSNVSRNHSFPRPPSAHSHHFCHPLLPLCPFCRVCCSLSCFSRGRLATRSRLSLAALNPSALILP